MTEYQFITIGEAAEQLKCSEQTVRRLIKSGKLKALDIGVKRRKIFRIPVVEFASFIQQQVKNEVVEPSVAGMS